MVIPDSWRYYPDERVVYRSKPHSDLLPTRETPVAAFDFDDTLVRRNSQDLNFPNAADRLRELASRGYVIAIFSNESLDHLRDPMASQRALTKKLARIDYFLDSFEIHGVVAFISLSKNGYQKPYPGMWDMLGYGRADSRSFFCGDAAGRRRDFSDSDKEFAKACGVRFVLPEAFFKQITT